MLIFTYLSFSAQTSYIGFNIQDLQQKKVLRNWTSIPQYVGLIIKKKLHTKNKYSHPKK